MGEEERPLEGIVPGQQLAGSDVREEQLADLGVSRRF
jgi:hypothetical protein